MAMARTTRKRTCQVCKSRKVRCDGKQPACYRCSRSDRVCSYIRPQQPVSFRHSKLSSLVASEPAGEKTSSPAAIDPNTLHEQAYHNIHISTPYASTPPRAPRDTHHSGPGPSGSFASPVTISTIHDFGSLDNQSIVSTRSRLYDGYHSRKLTSLEGELLHFYVQNIGIWLDVTSPERHFTYTVPRLALRFSLLRHAIMACSAHIIRLLDKDRTDLAEHEERYQHACVQGLIPVLGDLDPSVQDEVVLATIGILRMSEQYDEYHIDLQCHLVPGAFCHFHSTARSSTALGGLREATFYSYVRADIRMAILGRCGTKLQLDTWPLDNSYPTNDADWANRMTWLLVQTINLCYGNSSRGVIGREHLERLVDEWRADLPDTFDPYFYEESDCQTFPVLRLLSPWHIVGLQFYHSSKILLAIHNTPIQGFVDLLQFNRHLEKDILTHARLLCAISFSNDHLGCRINASHLLAMGAQFFTGKSEQCQVINYFNLLKQDKAWPSRACLEMLQEAYAITDK